MDILCFAVVLKAKIIFVGWLVTMNSMNAQKQYKEVRFFIAFFNW